MKTPARTPATLPLAARIPASTSNLGPGFDLVGLALSLFLEARVEERIEGRSSELRDLTGAAAEWPRGPENLLLVAFQLAYERLGGSGAFAISAASEVPTGRGFGSSGAAVAAGLILGAALAPKAAGATDLLRWGVELEGHPDNVAASLGGGLTLCHPSAGVGGEPVVVRSPLSPEVAVALAWPQRSLSTAESRAALPTQVAFADAVENPRRLALLLEGLRTGDPTLLNAGGEDRLHVPHRLPLIPGAREALAAARKAGAWLATISGAGSGLIALASHTTAPAVARAMEAQLGEAATSRVVQPVLDPPFAG